MPLNTSTDPNLLKIIAGMQTLEPASPKPTPASLLADAHAARSAGKREEAITLYNRVYHLNKSPEALAALTDMDAIEIYRGHNDSSAPAVSTAKALSLPTLPPPPLAPSEVQSEPPLRR